MLPTLNTLRLDGVQLSFDPLTAILALLLLTVVLLLWLLRTVRTAARLEHRLAEQLEVLHAVRTTTDLVSQRVGQLQRELTGDAARLREQVLERIDGVKLALASTLGVQRLELTEQFAQLRSQLNSSFGEHRQAHEQRHAEALQQLHTNLHQGFGGLQQQIGESLLRNSTELGQRVEGLTRSTDERLREIAGQVDRRLSEGFEKTTATFAAVLQRLALIDEAQKKITELSGEVVSLQEILADKRSRGAFGEVQLAALIRNIMPEAGFRLQHTLPNGKIADCVLFLPAPTGHIVIDAKFPLESFRRMTDVAAAELDRKQAERQFKQDIRKHIRDIATRYIIPNVTADGAVMFVPAEAVFMEIQAHHADLVEEAHGLRVWLVSPTTLWAILNTACAVLKDAATREQVDIIREHLGYLGKDFQRFRERMEQLARHIQQANEDVQKVNVSARRISERFDKIERVEFEPTPETAIELQQPD